MKAAVEMKAETRSAAGKGAARAVRRAGRVPVNVYGNGTKNQSLTLEARVLSNEYFKGGFMNKVVALQVDGKSQLAVARDIQLNPVSDKIEHADFIAVDEKSIVKVRVPVHFLNIEKSIGLKRGGALNIVRHEVELLAPVTNIPSAVEIDIIDLNIGDSIHINMVKLPDGVKSAIKSRNYTIASIAGRQKDEEVTPTAAPVAGAVPASTAKAPEGAAAAAPAAKK